MVTPLERTAHRSIPAPRMLSLAAPGLAGRTLQFLASIVAVLSLALGCRGDGNFFTRLDDSRRLAADLRVQFNKAADASNRAVMADTDEMSKTFANDAETTVDTVESDVAALSTQLLKLGFSNEVRLLDEFGKHFAEYRELDRTILTLAIENTNLEAQRLAFGPARDAADHFRDALGVVASSIPSRDRCNVDGLIARAMLAVRGIQVLHSPHIAEAKDAAMTSMEVEMADLDSSARVDVQSLAKLIPPTAGPALATALSSLDRFRDLSRQIVALSRRNSNVRSLELSLRTKPALTAACDETLRDLEDMLAKEGLKATR